MVAEKIINIDLNDPRAKEIAEVLGNESCKHILNLIAEKELTESDIAKELHMPLNTIDYNIKKLVKAGLIESTSHFWSIRGKRMPSYRVSEKKIVISPKRFSSNVLLIPALAIGGIITYAVKKLIEVPQMQEQLFAAKGAEIAADSVSMLSAPGIEEIAKSSSINFLQSLAGWEWFLIGIWFGIILFFTLTKFTQGGRGKK